MQNNNNIHLLPLWYKSPLDQFIIRNFTSNSAHFTEHENNTPTSKDLDLSSIPKEIADKLPPTSDDLDSNKKFEEAVHKANYPEGAEGAAKINEIVDKIKTERAEAVDKFTKELDMLRKEDVQTCNDKRRFGEIGAEEHIEQLMAIDSYYEDQKEEHHDSCDKELRELMEAVIDYKKDNNMPLQDSSDIDSSTDMPGPMDDE